MTTTKSITEQQISALRAEAYAAGDYYQGAICDLALLGTINTDDYTCLEAAEVRHLRILTRDDAIAACVDMINKTKAFLV
jgi:hypothetical protein